MIAIIIAHLREVAVAAAGLLPLMRRQEDGAEPPEQLPHSWKAKAITLASHAEWEHSQLSTSSLEMGLPLML